ncbi:MAG: hypothetical protein JXQ90_07570 [Cyclobacteriaceae bacterium]
MSLLETIKGRFDKDDLISRVNTNPDLIGELLDIALTAEQPQAWHGVWIVGHADTLIMDKVNPYVDRLIDLIHDQRDGFQREIIKVLLKVNLNDDQEGRLFDECMTLWESVSLQPSVRMFALKYIMQVVNKYPELKPEILFVMQDEYLQTLSPGIRRSAQRTKDKLLSDTINH